MRALVTGGAGFIGSTLVDRLLARGDEVIAIDNFSTGKPEFLANALRSPRFTLVESDLLDGPELASTMSGVDMVYHLAANADVRHGLEHPHRDLQQNVLVTHRILEAMLAKNVRRIAFSSTGSIYGEPEVFPTPERCPFPVQTSLYGASKLAAEGLISAYANGFGIQGLIFRFVSILGERYTHGHVFDFYRKLRRNPNVIDVLGNGKQRKSYLYVQDCIDAVLTAVEHVDSNVEIFNLGTDEYCTVDESLGWICGALELHPVRNYSGGERGWVGDSPFIFLDCSKIRSLGWAPKLRIEDGILRTLTYLQEHPDLLEQAP